MNEPRTSEGGQRTLIVIDWTKKKGSLSTSISEQGAKLPDEIRTMVAGKLLSDLRGRYEIEVRSL